MLAGRSENGPSPFNAFDFERRWTTLLYRLASCVCLASYFAPSTSFRSLQLWVMFLRLSHHLSLLHLLSHHPKLPHPFTSTSKPLCYTKSFHRYFRRAQCLGRLARAWVGGRDGLRTLDVVQSFDVGSRAWSNVTAMNTHRHGLGLNLLLLLLLLLLFFYTLCIKDPEGFEKKINLRNCQSDHYSGQSSRINESWSKMLL